MLRNVLGLFEVYRIVFCSFANSPEDYAPRSEEEPLDLYM